MLYGAPAAERADESPAAAAETPRPRGGRRASSLGDARKQLARLQTRWSKELPEAMACLTSGVAAATTFYAFPPSHWKKIRTTNGLERLHGEIKRRTKAVGAFPASGERVALDHGGGVEGDGDLG